MLTLSENMLRKNYTPQERAKIIQIMLDNWGGDKTALAKALGYSSAKVIDNWLAPLNLDPEVTEVLRGDSATITRRAALLAKLPRPVQVLTAEILNEKNPSDNEASKIVNAIKQNPNEPPVTVVERLESMPRMTSMIVYLTQNVNDAFEYACRELRLTKPKLAEKIIEEYLTKEDYYEKAKRILN
jgi:ParB-like chromosome segregation protein Spo0J